MTAPPTDAAGRSAVICGAGVPVIGIPIVVIRDDPDPPVCPWCGRRMSACQCEDDEVGF